MGGRAGGLLHCVVPGLTAPPDGFRAPRLPLLERILARAVAEPGPRRAADALFDAFRVPAESRGEGAWRRLGLTGERYSGPVLQAHPVHFRPDRDRLLLLPPSGVPSPALARRLGRRFDAHFAAEGLRLETDHPPPWFLLGGGPQARFTPLEEVPRLGLEAALPAGEGAGYWRRVLNECQMLFHPGPLEEDPEWLRSGVNGLWLDGAGRLSGRAGSAPARVEAEGEEPLLAGLQAGAAARDPARTLLFFDGVERARRAGDEGRWRQALERLETRLETLLPGHGSIRLECCDGRRLHWRPRWWYRPWRRRRPLHRLQGASAGPDPML